MNYLKFIEHAAENLQFYLWHRDYTKRFAELPDSERALSPEWTVQQAEAEMVAAQSGTRKAKVNPVAAAVFKGTDFDTRCTKVLCRPCKHMYTRGIASCFRLDIKAQD